MSTEQDAAGFSVGGGVSSMLSESAAK
jgi:hypothetical protein